MERTTYRAGDTAPDFTAIDVFGNTVTLSDYKKQPVLLVFLRYAGCPWCNLTVQRLTLEYPMLKEHNCAVIAFLQSDAESIKENIYDRHDHTPQFPIIPDKDKQFYKQYGVRSSRAAMAKSLLKLPQWVSAVTKHGFTQTKVEGDVFLVPATFLVAPHTQKIVHCDYGTSFYDFESLFPIYESLIFKDY